MKTTTWKHDDVLKNWMGDKLKNLGVGWAKYCQNNSELDPGYVNSVISEFTPLVEKLFLRFTTTSDFFGFPPVKVPKNVYKEIVCVHPEAWAADSNRIHEIETNRLKEREKLRAREYLQKHGTYRGYVPLSKSNVSLYYRSRLCASFPFLQNVVHHDGTSLRLTESEWIQHLHGAKGVTKWKSTQPNHDPYYDNLVHIVQSSGKLVEIGKILDQFQETIDGEGKPARLIFCSYFYVGAYIMYLVCTTYFSFHF
jgi:hypothetical protein